MISRNFSLKNTIRGQHHVLVVEKDTLQGHLLKVSLQEAGWVVRLADTPKEALFFCEHDFFDVAIINYRYSGDINGFILAQRFRKQYGLPSLMITAFRYMELKRCSAFSPKQDLLFKPYRLVECGTRLQCLLDGTPALREHRLGDVSTRRKGPQTSSGPSVFRYKQAL